MKNMMWFPNGNDNSFRNDFLNLKNMTEEQHLKWLSEHADVKNQDIIATAFNNQVVGAAKFATFTITIIGAGVVLVKSVFGLIKLFTLISKKRRSKNG